MAVTVIRALGWLALLCSTSMAQEKCDGECPFKSNSLLQTKKVAANQIKVAKEVVDCNWTTQEPCWDTTTYEISSCVDKPACCKGQNRCDADSEWGGWCQEEACPKSCDWETENLCEKDGVQSCVKGCCPEQHSCTEYNHSYCSQCGCKQQTCWDEQDWMKAPTCTDDKCCPGMKECTMTIPGMAEPMTFCNATCPTPGPPDGGKGKSKGNSSSLLQGKGKGKSKGKVREA